MIPHPWDDRGLRCRGVYVYRDNRPPRFQRIKAPDKAELAELVQLISQRVGRCLERQGLLEQDTERAWLELEPAEDADAMPQILGSSISYRIAVGPQQGRKAFMIRSIPSLGHLYIVCAFAGATTASSKAASAMVFATSVMGRGMLFLAADSVRAWRSS